MLQFQTKAIDICRISKLLVKHKVKASVTDSVITLDGDVSEELLNQLLGNININAVQNYIGQEPLYVPTETSFIESEESIQSEVIEEPQYSEEPIQTEAIEEVQYNEEYVQNEPADQQLQESYEYIYEQDPEEPNYSQEFIQGENMAEPKELTTQETIEQMQPRIPQYDLIYPVVKRGQVYWCDLGETYEHIQAGMRPVIIVSNNRLNMSEKNSTVVVIPCSTTISEYSNHYTFTFSSKTMVDYSEGIIDNRKTNAKGDEVRGVNKSQLRKFIGTMKPQFMKKMQDIIDDALQLDRGQNNVPNQKNLQKNQEETKIIQDQLLLNVDTNNLSEILQSDFEDKIKVQQILELFGFNLEQNGVQYLLEAILISLKDTYFNLETLSQKVSRKTGIQKEEVMRLIVARVKERFGLKKAPTIEFIRLINSLLK